eukprot:scaffold405274_cov20-Prasinocladus_malaysianus.AAC.1
MDAAVLAGVALLQPAVTKTEHSSQNTRDYSHIVCFGFRTPCHTNTSASHGVLISRDDGRTWEPKGAIEMDHSH